MVTGTPSHPHPLLFIALQAPMAAAERKKVAMMLPPVPPVAM